MAVTQPAPRFSVIIPVYNCETFVGKCVESVLQQTISDVEIILIDDGSQRDNSPQIVDQLGAMDPRVRAFHQANAGTSAARNFGYRNISESSEYIVFLDCDDVIAPDMLEIVSAYLESSPEFYAVSCDDLIIDENANPHPDNDNPDRRYRRVIAETDETIRSLEPDEADTLLSLLTWNGIRTPGCVLIRRSSYDQAGLSFRTDLQQCSDWTMWLDLVRLGPMARVNQKLLYYRKHSSNMSGNIHEMQGEVRKVRREVLASQDYTEEEKTACRAGFRAFEADAIHDKLRLIWDDTKQIGLTHGLRHAKYLAGHAVRYISGRP